ncbi:hypothetical protein BOTCAL_0050g00140 [Botryotinia calthae]|uniref:Uncharacterized protein n=1 Tax=Botryotinia calthae TaxID=38488 RepID=A0A4Y8DDC8_9HELO|nr:hypothetical protein BOTCAL_0050g00140 [Botryotinia calthae]
MKAVSRREHLKWRWNLGRSENLRYFGKIFHVILYPKDYAWNLIIKFTEPWWLSVLPPFQMALSKSEDYYPSS